MEDYGTEVYHGYETAAHNSFFYSLISCSNQTESLDSPQFSQCIKAAGINFATSYQQFLDYKLRRQQILNQGVHD